jgi:hypothetical protein
MAVGAIVKGKESGAKQPRKNARCAACLPPAHLESRARQASASAWALSACRTRASACRKPTLLARKMACRRGGSKHIWW